MLDTFPLAPPVPVPLKFTHARQANRGAEPLALSTFGMAIRASGNVSSITDNGVGDYFVNFTTAMQDANYAMSGSGEDSDGAGDVIIARINGATKTTTACRIRTTNKNADAQNYPSVEVMFFR